MIFFHFCFYLCSAVPWFPCTFVVISIVRGFLVTFLVHQLSLSFVTMKAFRALQSLLNTTVIISLKRLWFLLPTLLSEYSAWEAAGVHMQAIEKGVHFQLARYFCVICLCYFRLLNSCVTALCSSYVACLIIYFMELIEDSFVVAYKVIFGGCLIGPWNEYVFPEAWRAWYSWLNIHYKFNCSDILYFLLRC